MMYQGVKKKATSAKKALQRERVEAPQDKIYAFLDKTCLSNCFGCFLGCRFFNLALRKDFAIG